MLETSSQKVLRGFANYLARQKVLEQEVALAALHYASENKTSYVDYLVKQGSVSATQIARATSAYFGLPFCNIDAFNLDAIHNEFLSLSVVQKRIALPLFAIGGKIYVATTDPTIEILYEIRFMADVDLYLLIVEAPKLARIIDDLLSAIMVSEIGELGDDRLDNIFSEVGQDAGAEKYDVDSAPVVNYVNKILIDAIDKDATDIHFECYEHGYRIRFRQDGILYPIASPPAKLAAYLLARIKILSGLDITEHRVPQDGRFKLSLSGRKRVIDFRVSVCPTINGEKLVLRLLNPLQIFKGIESLGMNDIQYKHLLSSLKCSHGMILVTGPTGSGKTVTLYAALSYLNSTEVNISTVEDPVEIPLNGINQVNVNSKTGLTFASALRSFLRQDPDIMMVGEIRDLETAEIGVKAAQTGHLLLSTLHTNGACETVTRLVSLGISPYNLSTALVLIIAQRLIRTLCEACKEKDVISNEALLVEGFKESELGIFDVYKAVGCDRCTKGYRGRIGIFEVLPISAEMTQLIMNGANTIDIERQARNEGILSLRASGLEKVKQGVTSLAELNRVLNR